MTFSLTAILPLPDMLALGWFFLCWVGYAWYADHRRWGTRELASVLHDYRLRWMRAGAGAGKPHRRHGGVADGDAQRHSSPLACSSSPA
jgi:hypothetical protein